MKPDILTDLLKQLVETPVRDMIPLRHGKACQPYEMGIFYANLMLYWKGEQLNIS